MICYRLSKYLIPILFYLFSFVGAYCQEPADSISEPEKFYALVENAYGLDQVLINGIYLENVYRNALGYPYLKEDKYELGYIVIHGKRFDNIEIKYNAFDQSLVIRKESKSGTPLEIIPPNEFITEFKLNKKFFRKIPDETGKVKYYQVVYDGSFKCLYHWTKERVESFHDSKTVSYRFLDEVRKSYLLIGGKLLRYKSKGSFLSLFPSQFKPEIAAFCKKESINPVKADDILMNKLFAFYEKLKEKDNKGKTAQPN